MRALRERLPGPLGGAARPARRPFAAARPVCARLRVAAIAQPQPRGRQAPAHGRQGHPPSSRALVVAEPPPRAELAPRELDADTPAETAETAESEARRKGRQRGILLLNLMVLICGINWVVLKQSESVLDPSIFCIFRFAIAALAFWPYFKSVDSDIAKAGVEIGVWAAVGYLAQAQGLLTTDASHASFISTLTVLVVPILAGLSGRGVKALTWVSALAAFVGVGMLEDGFGVPSVGDLWQLVSAIAFGFQIFRTEHHSSRLSQGSALPLMSVVVATIAACSVALTAAEHVPETLHLLQHPGSLLDGARPPSWAQVLPVVWSALMSTDLVLLIEVLALHDVSSTDASIIYTMEPVLGAGFAYVLLGERWGPLGWVGAGLIVASSLLTQLPGLLPARRPKRG